MYLSTSLSYQNILFSVLSGALVTEGLLTVSIHLISLRQCDVLQAFDRPLETEKKAVQALVEAKGVGFVRVDGRTGSKIQDLEIGRAHV